MSWSFIIKETIHRVTAKRPFVDQGKEFIFRRCLAIIQNLKIYQCRAVGR
jgi:hypothetical protein